MKHLPHRSAPGALALSLAIVAACGGESGPSTSEVQQGISSNLPALFDGASSAMAQAETSTALASLDQSLAAIDSLGLPFSISPFAGDEASGSALMPLSLEDESFEDGDALAEWLNENLFTESNHQGGGEYAIPAEWACPTDDSGVLDPECTDAFGDLDLRIRVAIAGDGLDFTVLVGSAEPTGLELRSDRLSVFADFAEIARAASHVAQVAGEDIELPDVFEGTIAATMRLLAADDVSFELAVREQIEFEMAGVSFSTAAADPLAQLRFEGGEKRITAAFDLGATYLQMPWQDLNSESFATGDFILDWKGLSFTAIAADESEQIVIGNMGLGDSTSTISLDADELVAVDLNRDSGRRMEMTLGPDPSGGLPIVSLAPGMDLMVDVFMQPLADAGDPIESWLLDDSYRVVHSGDSPAMQSIEADGEQPGALRIIGGTLAVSSDSDSVTVVTGQCLLADPVELGEHPVLGALAAGPCP